MWTVLTTDIFDEWFDSQLEDAQEKILAGLMVART